jgi:hypothetical protein
MACGLVTRLITFTTNFQQLPSQNFLARACTLLLILFCLIPIIGYLNLPNTAPPAGAVPARFTNVVQLFTTPVVGITFYLLAVYFEQQAYSPAKKQKPRKSIAYCRTIIKFIGLIKLTILFAGILITAETIHHSLNAKQDFGWECNALACLLIFVPVLFLLTEIKNVKKVLA